MAQDVIGETFRAILQEELRPLREEIELLKSGPVTLRSLQAAGAAIGVSGDTVRRWVQRGRLRRYGSGRVLRVDLKEVIALMERDAVANPDGAEPDEAELVDRKSSPKGAE